MKMKYKRIMAAGMVFVMLCTGTGTAPVYGAQPSVDVDETMYVNLDYYGRVDKINVVKGWASTARRNLRITEPMKM